MSLILIILRIERFNSFEHPNFLLNDGIYKIACFNLFLFFMSIIMTEN
jgi:hypothetical protein